MITLLENCPCGTGKSYQDCCYPFIAGSQIPSTPEQLMRSRYTAYTQANVEYIRQTMCGKAAEGFDPTDAQAWARHVIWVNLEVLHSRTDNQVGFVEFKANYTDGHKKHCLHELSEFHLIDNKWFYVDGSSPYVMHDKTIKISRNDPCPCGSNKKFKKCCGQ